MNSSELIGVLGGVLGLVTLALGGWWRIELRVRRSEEDWRDALTTLKKDAIERVGLAELAGVGVQQQISNLRVHTAETYASKESVREAVERVVSELAGLRGDLRSFSARLDRLIDQKAG